ncbi:MAG: VOC family protein [Terracoccus sp.]
MRRRPVMMRSEMSMTTFSGISHLDLSVSDVEASAAWYEQVLGLRRLRRVDLPERTMIVLLHEPAGLVIGLNEHSASRGGAFDERRAGLDHVGFGVATREDLDAWQARLAELGVEHSAAADTDTGAALVFRDPDHIQLEFWWTRPRVGAGPS